MTLLELLLAIYATACGLILIAWRNAGRSLSRWIAVIGGVLTLAVVAEGSHRIEAVPMIVVAVMVACSRSAGRVGKVHRPLAAEFSPLRCVTWRLAHRVRRYARRCIHRDL